MRLASRLAQILRAPFDTSAGLHPPLVYRGAIAVGRLWRDDVVSPDFPVVQGPAVNDAQAEYEIAKGAFIHVVNPPAPFNDQSGWLGSPRLRTMFIDWQVPTEEGATNKKALTPFFHVTSDSPEGVRIARGFDDATRGHPYNVDTMAFIRECERVDQQSNGTF